MAALRRHAAARLDRARALVLAGAAAHGRAVRRARRDDARAPQHGAARDLARDRLDGRLRDALDRRGGLPLDARRRHVGAAGPDHRGDRHRPAAAADGGDARGPALLRARHRGARGARRTATAAQRAAARGGGGARRALDRRRAVAVRALARASGRAPATGSRPSSCSPSASPLWEWLCRRRSPSQSSCSRSPPRSRQALWDNQRTLWSAGWYTFKEALGGFVARLGRSAILFALFLARFRRLGDALLPYAIALERGPDHRVRADHERLVRVLNPHSKMAIAADPLLLPGDGEHAARPDVRPARVDRADALVRRERASRSSARCAFPTALPFLFAGLKVATVLAMIGASSATTSAARRSRSACRSRTRRSCSTSRGWAASSWRARSGSPSTRGRARRAARDAMEPNRHSFRGGDGGPQCQPRGRRGRTKRGGRI